MLKFIKKIFAQNKSINPETKNIDLINHISSILYIDDLEELLRTPTAKLYILNVYNESFNSFIDNILLKRNKDLIAINVFSYFKNITNLQLKLKRVIKILEENDIEIKIEYEFNEIIEFIKFIADLENRNV
jgi:hypothetical protein